MANPGHERQRRCREAPTTQTDQMRQTKTYEEKIERLETEKRELEEQASRIQNGPGVEDITQTEAEIRRVMVERDELVADSRAKDTELEDFR